MLVKWHDAGFARLFALESSCTMALSAEAWAKGQFHAVQTLTFPDEQPVRV